MDRTTTEIDLAALDALNAFDPTLRQLLRRVRLSINTLHLPGEDKADVINSFGQFVAELAKHSRHPDRLFRYWRRIDELAPTVAHELANAQPIQQLSLAWGERIQPKGGFLNEADAREYVESLTDLHMRRVLESAYAEMIEMSFFEGLRPEGSFDLLYFYQFLAKWSQYINFDLPTAQPH